MVFGAFGSQGGDEDEGGSDGGFAFSLADHCESTGITIVSLNKMACGGAARTTWKTSATISTIILTSLSGNI